MSFHALPNITMEKAREMTKTEMLKALAKHEFLKKTNEEKGYSWNKPAGDLLREQNPEKWKLLGSPGEDDPTPLRELVGLKDNVRAYLERYARAAGTGMRAARTLKRNGGRSRKTRRRHK